jgi:amidohydrolase
VGEIHAGSAPNITPETAWASASLRTLDPADRIPLHAAIRTAVTGTAEAYGCSARIVITEVDPVLDNDAELAAAIALEIDTTSLASTQFRSCGSDDFASYTAVIPSAMIFVGTGDGTGAEPGLHHPGFVPPDEVIADVATAYLAGLRGALSVIEIP